MKVARLVIGIITIIVSVVVFIIGLVLAFGNAYAYANDVSGYDTGGGGWQIVIALFLLAGGIVMVACHKKGAVGGCIACTVIFAIALLIGIIAGWGNILSILYLIVVLIFSIVGIPLAVSQRNKERMLMMQAQQRQARAYRYPPQR